MSGSVWTLRVFAVGFVLAMLGACSASYPTRTLSNQETTLHRPVVPPSEAQLLAVRIEAFDAGTISTTDTEVAKGLSPEIRSAESYYMPIQLKNTMQSSGHWGPVRVVPKGMRGGEVVVSGKILESDGEMLQVAIEVSDATGVRWFSREYEGVVDQAAYRKAEQGGVDPFQNLYNKIANDIATYGKTLKPQDVAAVRQVAELRFGAEFAPAVYEGYLQGPKDANKNASPSAGGLQQLVSFFTTGQGAGDRASDYKVVRLPAQDDPLVERVSRIRAREETLVDTLDQQYDGLARGVDDAYTTWRTSRLKEIGAMREADSVRNEEQAKAAGIAILGVLAGVAIASQGRGGNCYGCATAGVAVGGVAVAYAVDKAIKASEQAEATTKLHKAALEELGQSLASDVAPTLVEVEGQTVELRGSVEEKFKKWREVLEDLREAENVPLRTAPAVPRT